jgi:acetyl esterase/lipase
MAAVTRSRGDLPADRNVVVIRDLTYASPGGHALLADLHLPARADAAVPAIVWIHGGGWRAGNRRVGPDLSRCFASAGFAMVAIDYRLSRRAIFPAQIEDVKTAIRWVRSIAAVCGIDANRIGLWGASSGGHLAALAALTSDEQFTPARASWLEHSSVVQAVVDGYGPTDFLQMDAQRPAPGTRSDDPHSLLPPRPDMRSEDPDSYESLLLGAPIRTCPERARAASPLTYAHAGAPPFLLVHGLSDTTIAAQQSRLLFDALARDGNDATLVLVEALGHGFFNRSDLDEAGPRRLRIERSPGGGSALSPAVAIDAPVFSTVEAFFRRVLFPA